MNKYGLSRNIPAGIRRRVRQECGFGCVVCGLAIIQYEHIDPPFKEARCHEAKSIALLCGTCHDRVTRGLLSKARIMEARKNPITFKHGCSRDAFDIGNPFRLQVGNNYFENVRSIIRRGDNDQWFVIEEPESPSAPARLSAKFFDADGTPTLEIQRNEWTCPSTVWDLTVKGRAIEIRRDNKQIGLRLRTQPPHLLSIERLSMRLDQIGIEISEHGRVIFVHGSTLVEMECTEALNGDTVFQLP